MQDRLTSYERMKRMYEHREADRVPVMDTPWASTIERWQREGMPQKISYVDYFGLDRIASISIDNSPRFPEEIVEETDEYTIVKTSWGATLKNWKHTGGVPEFLDFTIKDKSSWETAKARMQPTSDRIDWKYIKRNYPTWRKKGAWIRAEFWFGFDVTHSWAVGTTRLLIAMIEQPDWVKDMFSHFLETHLDLYDQVWDAGYHFDEISWPDDMGYKKAQFFSLDMYREFLKPLHKRAVEWAHGKGVKVRLHSCGDIRPFVPELVEIGLDMLNPLEVKAGMDPLALKKTYGDRLAFDGGLNAVLYESPEKMWAEMERVIPVMKENGGYVAASDHSVPESVSLEDFRHFVYLAKKLGSYT